MCLYWYSLSMGLYWYSLSILFMISMTRLSFSLGNSPLKVQIMLLDVAGYVPIFVSQAELMEFLVKLWKEQIIFDCNPCWGLACLQYELNCRSYGHLLVRRLSSLELRDNAAAKSKFCCKTTNPWLPQGCRPSAD